MSGMTLQKLAPLLRGLTFDGDKGNIAHFQDNPDIDRDTYSLLKNANPDSPPPLYLEEASEDELAEYAQTTFQLYTDNHEVFPAVVLGEKTGVFFLGETYDKALAVKKLFGENMLPEQDAHLGKSKQTRGDGFDRNRVVKNKVSVVTGSAQGFGESIARHLVEAGSLVFLADINLEGAEALAAELNEKYNRTTALPVNVDVSEEGAVAAMMDEIVRQTGGIDLFISNAGVLRADSVKEMTLDTFKFVTDVNYIGYFLCTKHASPVMARQNEPTGTYFTDIIQINSKSGLEGSNKNAAYAGGKFGGIGLTQSFAKELVEDNIKVNSICPGNFFEGPLWSDPKMGLFGQYLDAGKVPEAKTIDDVREHYESQVPMKRGCRGEDVIKAIYYLIDQKYETGQAVPVTGGQIMLR